MEYFGKTKNDGIINKYWLKTDKLKVGILNYGGIITDIIMPDKYGNEENLVYAFDNIKNYETKSPKFGCIIGREAGRIAYGKFSLNGKDYNLLINNGLNHLHGGYDSLDKKVWNINETENGLELSYFSPDGECGYPGNVNFKVIYKLINNELSIRYYAETDEDTIINLTNHSYFNLSGNAKEDCLEHEVFINADKIAKLHKDGFVSSELIDVEGTPFDFRIPKQIGRDICSEHPQIEQGNGYDHPYILNKNNKIPIRVSHKNSGRILEMETDQKTVVFYSGNFLNKEGKLSCGANAIFRGSFCLETQNIPNHVNLSSWKQITTKEKPYYAETLYRFLLEGIND